MRKVSGTVLKIAVSIGLIVLLVQRVDVHSLMASARQADLRFFAIALGVSAMAMLIRSFKWQLLLDIQGTNLSLPRVVVINYMGLFFSNFFLGTFGGDAFRVYKTMNHSGVKSGAVSSVILERLTGTWAVLLVLLGTGIGVFFFGRAVVSGRELLAIVAFTAVSIVLMLAGLRLAWSRRLSRLRRWPALANSVDSLLRSMSLYRSRSASLVASSILSAGFLLANSVALRFFALSADVDLGWLDAAFLVSLGAVLIMLPISMNGIGIQEGVMFLYLERLGVEPSSALLVAVFPRIGILIFSLLGAALYVYDAAFARSRDDRLPGDPLTRAESSDQGAVSPGGNANG